MVMVIQCSYGSVTWPMKVANTERLETAHHKWLRSEENSSCVMVRQNYKRKYKGEDGTRGYEGRHQEEKTAVSTVAGSRVAHGQG